MADESQKTFEELQRLIVEKVGEELCNEKGLIAALRLSFEERDRLAQLDQDINEASIALLPDTVVNHLQKLTGIEAVMVSYFGAAKIDEDGLVETAKELIDEHGQMSGESVTIMGETYLIGPSFNSIEKTIEVGDVSKTVSVVFSDPEAGPYIEADGAVELTSGSLRVGSEVRYVDLDKIISLALVTKIHEADKIADLAVFDRERKTVGFESAVQYSFGIMGRTWHWPKD